MGLVVSSSPGSVHNILSRVHRDLDYSGPFGVLWVGLYNFSRYKKLCWKQNNNLNESPACPSDNIRYTQSWMLVGYSPQRPDWRSRMWCSLPTRRRESVLPAMPTHRLMKQPMEQSITYYLRNHECGLNAHPSGQIEEVECDVPLKATTSL